MLWHDFFEICEYRNTENKINIINKIPEIKENWPSLYPEQRVTISRLLEEQKRNIYTFNCEEKEVIVVKNLIDYIINRGLKTKKRDGIKVLYKHKKMLFEHMNFRWRQDKKAKIHTFQPYILRLMLLPSKQISFRFRISTVA